MVLDQNYWTQRYLDNNTPWQLEHASAPLVYSMNQITDKSAPILIPGAGNSREAIYLIEQGFTNIHVLDIAEPALEALKNSLRSDHLNLHREDFFEHQGSYDVILEQTFFCALESRFRESYPKKCHDLLKEDGHLKGVMFQFDSDRKEPPYGGSISEYEGLFSPYFDIKIMKECQISEPDRLGKELLIDFQKK